MRGFGQEFLLGGDAVITLDEASALAWTAHQGRTDKGGKPYHLHVFAVRDLLAPHGEEVQIAGVLHDIIEDTDMTADDLRERGVPDRIVQAILSVTRRPEESYDDLIARAAANPIGRLVKLADNAHNSEEERLALLPPEEAARLRERYLRARKVLKAPLRQQRSAAQRRT